MLIRVFSWTVAVFVALSSLVSAAQNNCSGSPAYGTCTAPAPPAQTWCAANNSASTCPGGKNWVGFDTTSPAAGSWSGQLEGLDASSILAVPSQPGAQADPVGGVGPTNANGVGQYLEFAGSYTQAFDRATGSGIFASTANGTAAPQLLGTLFAPSGSSYCSNPSLDGFASYDRIDEVFVLGNIFRAAGTGGTTLYYLCFGVSAGDGPVPASNLQGNNGKSYWNAYAYELNPALPKNSAGTAYFPDYARYGTWSDGFYVTWDLEDPGHSYNIVGFEVCQLDKKDIVAGLSSNPPQCYTYIPSYAVGTNGTDKTLIHTILPADFEGDNPIPADTAGEYFLAQVNPSNAGTNDTCSASPCTSKALAFWTWSGLTSGAGPTLMPLKFHPYTPGCYTPKSPANTYCIPEPYGRDIDSIGDRLMSRLAYRYITTGVAGEYLAVAHTVQEAATNRRTGIRYYKILAGKTPSTVFIGDIQDQTNHYFMSAPSAAMDAVGDLGITYTVTGSTAHGSTANYDPSPYFVTVNTSGTLGTPVAILSDSGASGQDETDTYWGEYVSVSSDPDDDVTFWAVDEYMKGNQTANCSASSAQRPGCTWASRIFTCQKGSGC
ncbi:MAG: hypothetical protein WB762_14115 [Candidatus Sulfotelmatobacter sp.]